MKCLFFIAIAMCSFYAADAQKVKDWIEARKLEAKAKADAKINQKASEGMDEILNTPEKILTKKKDKKKTRKEDTAPKTNRDTESNSTSASETTSSSSSNETTNSPSSNETTGDTPNDSGEFIIKTNIKCAAGKTHIETLLRETDGVNSVTINAATGKLYLSAGSNSTIYNTAIETINANGFEADGKKPASTKNKTCK
jgi:E3 ubiquitin-protein ligase DOA10